MGGLFLFNKPLGVSSAGFLNRLKSAFVKTTADKQWSNNKLFLLYFLLSIFPALMTYPWENPNMLRTFTVIPSIVYFVGLTISQIIKKTKQKYLWLIIIIIALSSFYELRTYFKYQSKVFNDSFEIKWSLDKAIKLKNPYEKVP